MRLQDPALTPPGLQGRVPDPHRPSHLRLLFSKRGVTSSELPLVRGNSRTPRRGDIRLIFRDRFCPPARRTVLPLTPSAAKCRGVKDEPPRVYTGKLSVPRPESHRAPLTRPTDGVTVPRLPQRAAWSELLLHVRFRSPSSA